MSAGTIGVDLVGCWYAAAPEVLEMEEALKPNLPTGDVVEESRCMLREHEPVLLEYGGDVSLLTQALHGSESA